MDSITYRKMREYIKELDMSPVQIESLLMGIVSALKPNVEDIAARYTSLLISRDLTPQTRLELMFVIQVLASGFNDSRLSVESAAYDLAKKLLQPSPAIELGKVYRADNSSIGAPRHLFEMIRGEPHCLVIPIERGTGNTKDGYYCRVVACSRYRKLVEEPTTSNNIHEPRNVYWFHELALSEPSEEDLEKSLPAYILPCESESADLQKYLEDEGEEK